MVPLAVSVCSNVVSLCPVSTEKLIPTLLTSFVTCASYYGNSQSIRIQRGVVKKHLKCELFLFLITL